MNKLEFIDILRKTLEIDLPVDKVEEHVKYYDEYISSMGDQRSQREEIERIGDPHLIAQTIIDSFQASNQYKYTGKTDANYYEEQNSDNWSNDYNNNYYNEKSNQSNNKSVWMAIKRASVIVLIVFILMMLFKFAFAIFIRIGIPVLICYFIIRLIKGHKN